MCLSITIYVHRLSCHLSKTSKGVDLLIRIPEVLTEQMTIDCLEQSY